MTTDPRLYRRFLLRVVHEGRAGVLATEFDVSQATVYRLIAKAVSDGAITRLSECAYSGGPKWSFFVDGIDTAYGGFSDSHLLSERGLRPENHRRAENGVRLARGWVNTGTEATGIIVPPVPPELASRLLRWGRSWRFQQEFEGHGTAQFYVGKNGASVVLHLRHRDYPDGLEDQVPKFQKAEMHEWLREIVDAYPGLKVVDRLIFHPDPKAHESRTPLPSGELVKRIHGVDAVARERVGPATETNNSPPGPAVETAGIEEARAIARAPFVQADILARLAALEDTTAKGFDKLATILERVLEGKPPEGPSSGPAPQGGQENPPGYA